MTETRPIHDFCFVNKQMHPIPVMTNLSPDQWVYLNEAAQETKIKASTLLDVAVAYGMVWMQLSYVPKVLLEQNKRKLPQTLDGPMRQKRKPLKRRRC